MQLEILTPDANVFSGRIKVLRVPGSKDPFTVLRNHAPIISSLEPGELTIVTEAGADLVFTISGGMMELKRNKIILLTEHIIREE
jgi:F-type H+-transporting ATPase subunit epsilon